MIEFLFALLVFGLLAFAAGYLVVLATALWFYARDRHLDGR